MKSVRAIINDPYYKQPSWLPQVEYCENAYLSKDSNTKDVVLFLTLLCGYNDVDIKREPNELMKELIQLDDVALSGGIAFEDQDKAILPSCCCGLEQWKDVTKAVVNNEDVWLGHDPFPTLEYIEDSVRIWSDDIFGVMREEALTEQEKQNMFFIEFNRTELIDKLKSIELDLQHFFKYPLTKELAMVDSKLLDQFYEKYCKWLSLDMK